MLSFSEAAILVGIIYGPFILIGVVLGISRLNEALVNRLDARRIAAAARPVPVTARRREHLVSATAEAA